MAELLERCDKQDEEEDVLYQRLRLAKTTASSLLTIDAHSDLIKFYRRTKKQVFHKYFWF